MTQLILANLIFFIPMALVGFVLFGEVPVHSVVARQALRITGLMVGAVVAAVLLTMISTVV